MNNFTFYSPTFFAFGKDSENDTGSYVKRFGGSKVLIHYGGGSVVRSGLLDRVKASLEKEGLEYVLLGVHSQTQEAALFTKALNCAKRKKLTLSLLLEAVVQLTLQRQSLQALFMTATSGISIVANGLKKLCLSAQFLQFPLQAVKAAVLQLSQTKTVCSNAALTVTQSVQNSAYSTLH